MFYNIYRSFQLLVFMQNMDFVCSTILYFHLTEGNFAVKTKKRKVFKKMKNKYITRKCCQGQDNVLINLSG